MSLQKLLKDKGTPLATFSPGRPSTSLVGSQLKINNTFVKGEYQLYLLDTKELARARDLTDFGPRI